MFRWICLALGYLFGNFSTGYLLARARGVDILHSGSENPGSTNALRTMGLKAGLLTLAGDMLKLFIPLWIAHRLFPDFDTAYLTALYTGSGTVLGHNFPVLLKFHGGKGIACTAALLIYLSPVYLAVFAVLFLGAVFLTRWVSLGSILGCIGFFAATCFCVLLGRPLGWGGSLGWLPAQGWEIILVTGLLCGLAVWRHRANIKRIRNGSENRISFHKK